MTEQTQDAIDLFADTDTSDTDLEQDKDYVTELVGDGKKFKSIEDLAKGKVQSDRFITNLQTELAELRADLKARTTFEELLTNMNSNTKTPDPARTNATPLLGDGDEGNATAGLTAEQIEEMVNRRLSAAEQTRVESQNFTYVQEKLREKFGENFSTQLKQTAAEMGLDPAYLNQLAKTQPKVLLKLVDADGPVTSFTHNNTSTNTSSVNSGAVPRGNTTGEKLKSYYDNIRRTDPNAYWKPKIQNEIHAQATRLGETFYKG